MAEITPIIEEPEGRILHRLTAYMDGDAYPEHTRLTQYDTTLPILAVSLQCSGRPYEVPTAGTVSVRMRKPDGHHVYNPALGLSSDRTTAYIVITSQMTAAAGNAELAIEVMADGGVAASGILSATVVSNPVPESAYESTDEAETIVALAARVTEAAATVSESEAAAARFAANAAASESNAAQSAANASTSEAFASASASSASRSAASASADASAASVDAENAKRYYNQSKEIADNLGVIVKPKGLVPFASLPAVQDAAVGDLYVVTDGFTTTADFDGGAGRLYPAYSVVVLSASGKWACLSGASVVGVKGGAESAYRNGNVSLTPANIGAPAKSDIAYAAGNTFNLFLPGFGWVTGSGASVVIYLFFPKRMFGLTPNITSLSGELRHVAGGYITPESGKTLMNYLQEATINPTGNGYTIRITLYKAGGWGVTNNTPVVAGMDIAGSFS